MDVTNRTHGDRLFDMYGPCNLWMERVGLPDQSVGANDRHAPADDENNAAGAPAAAKDGR